MRIWTDGEDTVSVVDGWHSKTISAKKNKLILTSIGNITSSHPFDETLLKYMIGQLNPTRVREVEVEVH